MTLNQVTLIHEAGLVNGSYRQEEAVSSPVPLLQHCSPVFSQPFALDAQLLAHYQWVAPLSQGLPDWSLALSLVRRDILSPVHTPISELVRICRKTAQLLSLYKVIRDL